MVLLVPVTLARAQAPDEAGPAPEVVFAGRDLRMNLAGVIAIRVGCFADPGDVCTGRIEARLAEPVRAPTSKFTPRLRRWEPFVLGRRGFSVASSRGRVVRLQLYPRGGYLLRLAGTVPVRLTAYYGSRGRSFLEASRDIDVYVSPGERFRLPDGPQAP